jgi:glycosyltransferase involved in cell wall biosynthesis
MGLSPFPRGDLFDSASPTKAIEYLALGLPVVCNDQPDQMRVAQESGGGICVDLTSEGFASGILHLLENPERARAMSAAGKNWVEENRNYRRLAAPVATALASLSRQQTFANPSSRS